MMVGLLTKAQRTSEHVPTGLHKDTLWISISVAVIDELQEA